MPEPKIQRACACGAKDEDDLSSSAWAGELNLLRKPQGSVAPSVPQPDPSVSSAIEKMRGGGRPLSEGARAFMEPRFGTDFSNVRIHAGSEAAILSRSIQARAFTVGRDIFFNRGEYQPASAPGRELLAHELTHTLQQGAASAQLGRSETRAQRTIGDGHDLASPRFSGNVRLEAAFDDETLIQAGPGGTIGSRGAHVRLLQQALLDMGYTLPEHGVDGLYGPETAAAVTMFQTDAGAAQIDGIVGDETMALFDRHDPQNAAGPGPPARQGPVPSPRPTVGGGCAQHFAATTFTLANQTATGASPAATIAQAALTHPSGGGRHNALVFRGTAHANYSPRITINAPNDPTARQYDVGLVQNILTMSREYFYSNGSRFHTPMPMPMKDGAPLSSGVYHPIFAEDGGGHPNILEAFTANGDTRQLVLPDTPSDFAFTDLSHNPECPRGTAANTLISGVITDTFRTWVVARHNPSGCTRSLHHIDWGLAWSAILLGGVLFPLANAIVVTTANGNGAPAFIQGGRVPADLFLATRTCVP